MTETHANTAPTYEEAPELFDGILSRRLIAFFIDAAIITILFVGACFAVLFLGFLTLGLAWLLFGAVFPVVALGYTGFTLAQPESATIGMRMTGIEMRTWNGERMYFLLGALHALVFWLSISVLTPLILLVGLFNPRGRLLQDFVLGTFVVNSDAFRAGE